MKERILIFHTKGVTTRDIDHALHNLYCVEISYAVISHTTDSALDEDTGMQNWPLNVIYPILCLGGQAVKIHQGIQVVNKSYHVVLGVNLRDEKEVHVQWIAETEGAKICLSVLTEQRHRSVQDVYIACMDGLKGCRKQ